MSSIGFTLPFIRATGSIGYFEVTRSELAAIEQNIRSLLVTNWGERVMHYNFGCNLNEFIFEPEAADGDLKQRIADRIVSQVDKWLPSVVVDDLAVLFPEDDPELPQNSLRVMMGFSIRNKPDLRSVFDQIVAP